MGKVVAVAAVVDKKVQKEDQDGGGAGGGGEKVGKLFLPSLPLPVVSSSLGMALREEEGRGGRTRIEIGFQETREGGFAGVGGGPISKRG